MNVKLITIGKMKDAHYAAKVADYTKRLSRYAKFSIVELKDSTRAKEGQALVDAIARERGRGHCFALTEEGRTYDSPAFAKHLEKLACDLIFVIGGPEGLEPEVKATANNLLSLSPMTFTHEMARVLLIEQIYRAFSITHNGKYHK